MAHAYPDFLVVGMMKAGTTSIHRHLADHPPHVVEPIAKELHYFASDYGGVWVPEAAWGVWSIASSWALWAVSHAKGC